MTCSTIACARWLFSASGSSGACRARLISTAARSGEVQMPADELVQARPFGQLQHRSETSARHEVRIIEDGVEAVADSHLAGAPLVR
jgi:hypothetical protein